MRALAIRRLARAGAPLLVSAALAVPLAARGGDAVRLKDLGRLRGWRDNALVGYGVVTGLAGTGDSPTSRATRQALANVFSRLNLAVPADQLQSRNVAVVMVSAALPPSAREGDTVDVNVTSAGDARSLLGGTLLLTPLQGPDGRVYALAQGSISVGGYRYDANGNVVQKNHATAGSIPNGATVEVGVEANVLGPRGELTFVLTDADYTTASLAAEAINAQLVPGLAAARDASGIEIDVPEAERARLVAFVARVENVHLDPDRRARVVVDERTGTVVAGGDVRISRVVVSHGDIKVSIAVENAAVQPTNVVAPGPGVRTALVSNTRVDVDERAGPTHLAPGDNTVADLVQSLAKLKTNTRDIISILRAIKAAGALHAELVVQ